MRYITEFKIPLDVVGMDKDIDRRIEYSKQASASELGNLIASKIGFEEKPDEGKYFALDVQCFSMKDWNLFKQQLKSYIETVNAAGIGTFNLIVIGKMFKELEEKGLPETENKPDK